MQNKVKRRNEKCSCGSGLKYKNCCMSKNSLWSKQVEMVATNNSLDPKIVNTFNSLNKEFNKTPLTGGCYTISAAMFILLKEQQIECTLCIGGVLVKGYPEFPHSWVEIEEKSFDIAIRSGHCGLSSNPVFYGIDLELETPTEILYGVKDHSLTPIGVAAQKTPLTQYLDGDPEGHGWRLIQSVGNSLGLNLNLQELKDKYRNTLREFTTH
jgi:hypothetical protein